MRRPESPHGAAAVLAAALLLVVSCASGSVGTLREAAPDRDGGEPGAMPAFQDARPGRPFTVTPRSGPSWTGVVRWSSGRPGEESAGGTLDAGGTFWVARRGDVAFARIRPARGEALDLPPLEGGLGDPVALHPASVGKCGPGRPGEWRPAAAQAAGKRPAPGLPSPPGPAEVRSGGRPGAGAIPGPSADEPIRIRVAFMYTPEGKTCLPWSTGEPEAALTGALNDANTCMSLSGLCVVFEYAGLSGYPYGRPVVEGGTPPPAESVTVIAADIDCGSSEGAKALSDFRDRAEADVVCVVTGRTGDVAGWAPVIAEWGSAGPAWIDARAWMVVRCNTLKEFTFAHEAAHLLGCGHQRGVDAEDVETQHCYSRGWVYESEGVLRATVECQTVAPGLELPLGEYIHGYSAPCVIHWSAAMGEPHDAGCSGETQLVTWPANVPRPPKGADSASTMRFTAPLLANVR